MNVVVERQAKVIHGSQDLIRQMAGRSPVVRDGIVVYVIWRDLIVLPDIWTIVAKLTACAYERANGKVLARRKIPIKLANGVIAVSALRAGIGVVVDL